MSVYWDSSTLVACASDSELRLRLEGTRPWCRPHALAEVFSTLTGGRLGFRIAPEQAATIISGMADYLQFVELSARETMEALSFAQGLGVRGGRVHDFLHAVAAKKAGCSSLLTLNAADFVGIDAELSIESA